MYILKEFGSFYLGGREIAVTNRPITRVTRNKDMVIDIDPNGHYTIEPIYVQYFLPKGYKKVCILIHGGGHTGAIWENTPDHRKGWLHLLLEKKIGVYVVDTVERGRSGWCVNKGFWPGEPEVRTHETIWKAFRLGPQLGIPYPHLQFPVEHFLNFVKQDVPRWNCNALASTLALTQLIEKIGECTLIAHSQGADIAMQVLNRQAALVKSIILIEPAAFPIIDLTKIFLPKHILMLFGDYIHLNDFWKTMQQTAMYYCENLSKLGITTQWFDLPKLGIYGNSHMMMIEKNNHIILSEILTSGFF